MGLRQTDAFNRISYPCQLAGLAYIEPHLVRLPVLYGDEQLGLGRLDGCHHLAHLSLEEEIKHGFCFLSK